MSDIVRSVPFAAHEAGAERYDDVAIVLHWTVALLVLINIPLGIFHDWIETGLGFSLMWVHKSIGLSVLAVSIGRLAWRLSRRPPRLPAHVPAWQAAVSGAVHAAFYVLMIAVPLTGWMRSSANDYPLTLFKLVDVPKFPIQENSLSATLASSAHEALAWTMVILAMAHILAALHHGYVVRDNLMDRMRMKRSTRSSSGPERRLQWLRLRRG